jgi:hypothetical protein
MPCARFLIDDGAAAAADLGDVQPRRPRTTCGTAAESWEAMEPGRAGASVR